MDRHLTARIWAAINKRAHSNGRSVSIDAVCDACAEMLGAQGVAVALTGGGTSYEPVCARGLVAHKMMELQVVLGEGPGLDAIAGERPVLVGDLAADDALLRWPRFAPAAASVGVRAMSAHPLLLGAIAAGVLEISRTDPGWPTPEESAIALAYADAALLVEAYQLVLPAGGWPEAELGRVERWAEVHQATGMIAVQTGSDLATAFVRLRAHAYAAERGLREVARDVLSRRLRFEP